MTMARCDAQADAVCGGGRWQPDPCWMPESGMVLSASKDAWLRPKHGDTALSMVLLNASGLPACMPPGECVPYRGPTTPGTPHGMFFGGPLGGGLPWWSIYRGICQPLAQHKGSSCVQSPGGNLHSSI